MVILKITLVFFSLLLGVTFSPVFGEVYVNEYPYEFSINYPSDWQFQKSNNFFDEGIIFYDELDWKSRILVFFTEIEEPLGNDQEIMELIQYNEEEFCLSLSFQVEGFICENFQVLDIYQEIIDDKKSFTIISSYVNEYSDPNYPGKYPMVGTNTFVMDGNHYWQILSESEEHVFEKYSYDVFEAIYSFTTTAPSEFTISPTSGVSYKIYFDELPSWAPIHVDQILKSASDYWNIRDGITFQRVYDDNQSDISISWTKNSGQVTLGYAYYDLIQVGLGDDFCNGDWQPFSQKSVADILTHELGHAIGYEHIDDVSDVMYHIIDTSYEFLTYADNSMIGYAMAYPMCTIDDGITSDFRLTSNTNHRYDIFYVPSITEYDKFIEGENYRSTCQKNNVSSTSDSCKTNVGGFFIVNVIDGSANELANYELIISESTLPAITETILPPITINDNPPSQKNNETIHTNQDFFQVHSNEFTTVSISGFVPEQIFSGQYPVYLTISFGGNVISELKVPITANGYFNVPFQLSPNSSEGTYLISGKNMGNSIGSTTFTLGSSNIVPPPSVIPYDVTSDQTEQKSTPSDFFTSYSSNKNGFAINHPEKWIIEENYECPQEEPCMFLLLDNSDYWSVEVNVNFWKNAFEDYEYSNDEQYLKDLTDVYNDECINYLEYYETQCSNYELIYAKAITVSGIKAYEIHYTWTETYGDGTYENFVTTVTEIPQGDDMWQIYSETLEEYSDYNSKLIEKILDSFSIKNVYAEEIPVEEITPKIQCGEGTILKHGKCEILTQSENLNTQLYYNEEYSFSIEYANGWRVNEYDDLLGIVSFLDGSEECTMVFLDCLWNTNTMIILNSDYGERLSDSEERKSQIEYERNYCNNSTVEINGFTCRDFTVIKEFLPTTSIDRYPVITTKYTMTKSFPDDFSSDIHMVGIISSIYVGDDIWDIRSESDADAFNEHEKYILNTVSSFKLPAIPPVYSTTNNESEGGGCLIATATYGSELAPQVQLLREIRDNSLLQTESGITFMNTFNDVYYSFSPIIADYERENPIFKEMVKVTITPMITSLSLMEYADSESEVLGVGISLIILNGLMYVGIPASVIVVVRRF